MLQLRAVAPFKPLKADTRHGGKTTGKKGDPSKHRDIGAALDSILAFDMPQGEWVENCWSRAENLRYTRIKKTNKQLSSAGQASASDVGDQITATTTATAIKKYDRVGDQEAGQTGITLTDGREWKRMCYICVTASNSWLPCSTLSWTVSLIPCSKFKFEWSFK